MFRAVGAVLAGYLVFGVAAAALFAVTGRDPHVAAPMGFMIARTLYGMVFAALGGYVAARRAARRPGAHAVAVAAVMAFGAFVSLFTRPGGEALWSELAALVLMVPSAAAGGLLPRRLTRA